MKKMFARLVKFLKPVLRICPIYNIGLKTAKVKDQEEISRKIAKLPKKDKEVAYQLIQNIKFGKTIAIIGLLCPLFWLSLLSGQRGGILLFHFTHSSLFVVVGLLQIKKGKATLLNLINPTSYKVTGCRDSI